jgi:hypothetical protein
MKMSNPPLFNNKSIMAFSEGKIIGLAILIFSFNGTALQREVSLYH